MYLRRRSRRKGGEIYESWALVETVRTARGPRQRTVVTVGKLPGLDEPEKIGWEEIGRVLDGKPAPEASLFEQGRDIPSWATHQLDRERSQGDMEDLHSAYSGRRCLPDHQERSGDETDLSS